MTGEQDLNDEGVSCLRYSPEVDCTARPRLLGPLVWRHRRRRTEAEATMKASH